MRRRWFGSLPFSIAFSQAALCADLPITARVATAPGYSWTGFYLGLNGGYGWNNTTGNGFCTTPAGVISGIGCNPPTPGRVQAAGGLFGAQAGYNVQSGAIVYGIETDLQWSGLQDRHVSSVVCCFPVPVPVAGSLKVKHELQWFGTVRGRLGYALLDRGLIYATAGMIYGHESVSSLLAFPGIAYPASVASTRLGGIVGGGVEYAFDDRFTAKVEGLYYDMGSQTISFSRGFTSSATFHYTGIIVRGGVNYRF